jgi:multidrug resistance efflux pump
LATVKADVAADLAAVKADVAAVKADLAGVKADVAAVQADVAGVKADVAATNDRLEMLRSEFHHSFDELKETMRDGQTELLRAFYSYAQSADAKLKEGEVADFLIRGRLTAMEIRQTDMERRLNTPPPPQ